MRRLLRVLIVACGLCLLASVAVSNQGQTFARLLTAQETFPAPPADRALVYVSDNSDALAALPFETATTPLAVDKVAGGEKRSYVELKGESAATVLKSNEPRFYLFVPDTPNAHPPFIVRLTPKRGARRVTALAQKGYTGFAIDSAAIIKPRYRVLGREGGMLYMEIRAREWLLPGEYAMIGTDLQRIATFRITGTAQQ